MDIGALMKGKGKDGKGKGKDGKGKGKDAKGKVKIDKANLLCWNCGRFGHEKEECWRPTAPKKVIEEAKTKN